MWAFLDNHFPGLMLLALVFGVSTLTAIVNLVDRRRKDRALARRHALELEKLRERRLCAEATGNAIQILLADEDLTRDFDRRLRVAMGKARVAPEIIDAEVEPEAEAEEEPRGRRRRRRRSA